MTGKGGKPVPVAVRHARRDVAKQLNHGLSLLPHLSVRQSFC